ncbi:MAG: penicillin acylase family protein [Balneolaceae bacterium]
MHYIKAGFSGVILLAVIISLHTKFGAVPPLGKFFDPQSGFWSNAETSPPESEILDLPGLQEEVSIYFDERRVAHIFAENDHDLYYAQGFITARDRLFQMELQTYDAAGRLAEFLGEGLLPRDLNTRRTGMPYGAEKAQASFKNDPKAREAIEAYSDGVNQFISSLSPADLPIEYKILDFEPEAWEPLKTAQLLKNMTRSLAGRNYDVTSSNTRSFFGDEFIERFFNQKPELNDPIISSDRKWNFTADVPQAPEELFKPSITTNIDPFAPDAANGSNSWAVSGAKTKNGYPILANDPHLEITLPSIWYEIQLSAPGTNSYGVSLPGAPAVIIGFNENIAWGETNVGSDVMDWYEVKFKDKAIQEYWHDEQWKPTSTRIEEVKVRGQETVFDTLVFTHHGPVTQVNAHIPDAEPIYHALRWIAHDSTNDLMAFIELNRAKNYDDYENALAHYMAPAQNFIFASTEGDIALWVNGKLPKKWKYQGRTVSDGTDPLYDWHGWIPREHNPWEKNPPRNFVSSANQESAAPDYPYYLDDDFAPFERGRRINELLSEMEEITPQNMQGMQLDLYSYHAETILPFMLQHIEEDSLNSKETEILQLLKNWDYMNDGNVIEPSVFKEWWDVTVSATFNDEYRFANVPLRLPGRDHFAERMKNDPDFILYDSINTPDRKEDGNYIINWAFKKAIERLEGRFGEFGDSWKWGYYNKTNIGHVALIPGLGASGVFTSGGAESINAIRGSHGPSWRMVVELGPEVKAWGVYPGGISGNPGSPNYDAFLEIWRTGELYELDFMRDEPEEFVYKMSLKSAE